MFNRNNDFDFPLNLLSSITSEPHVHSLSAHSAEILLIAIGLAFMGFGIINAQQIKKFVDRKQAHRWFFLVILMLFFVIGYVLTAIVDFYHIKVPNQLFISFIFCAGGLFVWLVMTLAKENIFSLYERTESLKHINTNLDSLVHEKTEQLRESLEIKTQTLLDYESSEKTKSALESKLRQKHKMEAIGTMAGGIAHDFNNILAIVMGNVTLIQTKLPDDNPCKKNLDNLLTASIRGSELVKQILAYSRQEKPTLLSLNLSSALDDILDLLASTLPPTIDIHKNVDDKYSELLINVDKTQFQQVLINLCNNAAHAMKGEGVLSLNLREVHLETGDKQAPYEAISGSFAQLSIEDTGEGISPDVIEKIFDPFFTTKPASQGTGMGLSVVLGIIENHRGIIEVESVEGEGTTFHLFFPLSHNTITPQAHNPDELNPKGHENILFVDDEEMLADVGREMLEGLGYSVTSETDSRTALERFTADPAAFDLVITDQTMPGLSGVDLTAELLKIRKDLPVILCSGYNRDISRKNAQTLGIKAFCNKPVSVQYISRAIRNVLDGTES